ncbi:MAG: 1-acyl-sn-glycerol-3-phosphate acyltransferase [Treponema sp.]|nr:1-acyl-sn-glycerol-3-phosphate acyltransferase [Treponema sp.]
MLKTILSVIYLIFSMIFLLPFGLITGFFYLLGLRKLMPLFTYLIAKVWAWTSMKIAGCTVTVTGLEKIPKKDGVCFVSNHVGYFDIVLLLAYCGRPFGFVAKKELLFFPFLNVWIYLLGGLFIDRGNIRKAVRTINKGVRHIKSGGGMLIFPEGHRSKDRGLLPFHSGSLKLATSAEAPIIPVAIKGSYDILEKHMRVIRAPVKIAFLEPIITVNIPSEDRKQVLCDRIFSVIKKELENDKEQPDDSNNLSP